MTDMDTRTHLDMRVYIYTYTRVYTYTRIYVYIYTMHLQPIADSVAQNLEMISETF